MNSLAEPIFTTKRWRHVAVTFANDAITVYLDGRQTARSTNISIRPRDFRPIFNYIGRSQFVADPTLRGNVDDIQIYNYALSADDIARLYKLETVGIEGIKEGNQTQFSQRGLNAKNAPEVYDLSGRRLQRPVRRGVNIVEGKKVVITDGQQ